MDDRNVMLEIRAGTGGSEAGLFAGDLVDVYQRYGVSVLCEMGMKGILISDAPPPLCTRHILLGRYSKHWVGVYV